MALLIALTSGVVPDRGGLCIASGKIDSLGLRCGIIGHVKIAPMAEPGRTAAARFSDRADDYVRYRPHYSPEVVQALREACGLRPVHVIADVGCPKSSSTSAIS
jgi:hypothetical protein